MNIVTIVIAVLVGICLGSLNGALIMGKLYKIDVRAHGSKNAGATNALRVLGKPATVFVILIDVCKGILAIALLRFFSVSEPNLEYIMGFSVIIGHCFPVFFGGRGGKGVLTSLAVILMLNWQMGLILLAVGVAIIGITRYVSLGSCVAALILPFLVIIFQWTPHILEFFLFSCANAILVLFMHRGNIRRLLNGTENKLK